VTTSSVLLNEIKSPLPRQPFFSILILCWNSTQYLKECLNALVDQSFRDFEVLLLDNGSDQPLPTDLKESFPATHLTVMQSDKNLGFAGGNNFAAKHAKGDYIVLLNADAFPEPDWLENINRACLNHPGYFFASRLIKANDPTILDGEWNVYHASGLAWRRNHAKSVSQAYPHQKHVFSACAAASIYPRSAYEAVGGFDEDFFSYMEDLDLDFRLQLSGYPCLYLPDAIVRHVGAGSTHSRSGFMLRHGHRNLIWTFVKDMPGAFFWLLLPWHILANLIYFLLSFLLEEGSELRRGKLEALHKLPEVWEKRKQVQRNRKVSAWSIAKQLDWNPLSPLIKMTYK